MSSRMLRARSQARGGSDGLGQTIAHLLLAVVALAGLAWALAGCGSSAEEASVTGTVAYPQPAEPPAGMVLIVQIQDIFVANAPPTVLGEQRIHDPGTPPVDFEIAYDPAAVDQAHSYIVHARIEDGSGSLLYTTMQNYAVITQGHPTQGINVVLEMVGSGAPDAETPSSGGLAPGGASVSGTVAYPLPAEALPGAVLIVEIQDVSDPSAPVILGEQRISDPGTPPVAFEVAYDPAAIDEAHAHIVQARIEDSSGNLLYTTMQYYAVITQGHPTRGVNVLLEMLGGNTTPT
ncbi:MAG: YbaY family lipoprotein [Anaerolineae bacterium]|nr:YbaY family lipoprotein [Anaerolineae bacterium]